jgi:peptidoglycan/LPS O-acetylase OafA/YrhL
VSNKTDAIATATVLLVAGAALAVATLLAGSAAWAAGVGTFTVAAAAFVLLAGSRDTDLAAAVRGGGDERQRGTDRDAVALAGLLMIVAALVGAIISAFLHQGNPGPLGVLCAVGAVGYIAGRAIFRR